MSFDVNGAISGIGKQAGNVDTWMGKLMESDTLNDPEKMIQASMQLMKEQQKLTTMTESFTKSMKANHDAAKAAITNMH
jgi:uncharacterized protein YeaO (DUF488 family)